MQLKKIMEEWPIVLHEDLAVRKALEEMSKTGVGAAPVINSSGIYRGIVTLDKIYFVERKDNKIAYSLITNIPVLNFDIKVEDLPEFDVPFLPVVDYQFYYRGVITHRKLIKIMRKKFIELKNLNRELEEITENSHDGFCVFDKNGIGIKANKAIERVTGLKREEVIGNSVKSMEDNGVLNESVTLKVLKEKRPITITQIFYTGKQCIVTGIPIFNENGEIVKIVTNIRDITELNALKEEIKYSKQLNARYLQELNKYREQEQSTRIVAVSKKMQDVLDLVYRVSQVDSTILIQGESGVGKEVIASLIYESGKRKGKGPFIKINCAAIPEQLLESEMFGYEGGAFTGAKSQGKAGVFELADKGVLFLDEIAELSGFLQAKLLRVIQEKEFTRLGSVKPIKVDVQIITATNKDLAEMVRQNRFREDLFYRLNVVPITIPPLRERKEDILPLVLHFLQIFNNRYNLKKSIDSKTIDILIHYNWLGNVRELANVIERIVITAQGDLIKPSDLPKHIFSSVNSDSRNNDSPEVSTLKQALDKVEKSLILKALERYGNTYKAAEALGISQSTFVRRVKKYRSNDNSFLNC